MVDFLKIVLKTEPIIFFLFIIMEIQTHSNYTKKKKKIQKQKGK